MRIVISGGTGLVGRALIHELRSAGHSCVVLTRAVDRHTDLREVAFEVRGGEIFGIAGVAGNGQTELLAALSGERPAARILPA